jgi:hypothetical protein
MELASNKRSTVAVNLADAAVARLVTRLSSEYVLRALQLTIEAFGDLRAGLLAQAINTANTAHFNTRSEEWGRRAIGSGLSFPDEMRRPISVSGLAASTGLPLETTRRVVKRLIASGECVRVDGGVIIPMETLQRPAIAHAVIANVGYVMRFVRDLQAAGFVADVLPWPQQGEDEVSDTFDARVLGRLSAEYLLRALRLLIDTYGDIRDGILAHTIVTANTSHLDVRGGDGWRYARVDQTPPDEARRPISVARLAESLGLPFETARRHVRRLMDAGVCTRVEGGLIVPQAVLDRPEAARSALANVGYVRKFVRDVLAASLDAQRVRLLAS